MSYENLFSPGKIGSLELKNRIIFPPMGSKMSKDGQVNDQLIKYQVARAKGGCALNFLEVTAIHKTSHTHESLALYDDMYMDGFKKAADAIHAEGGKLGVQLYHGGPVAYTSEIVSASEIPGYARALSTEEVKEMVQCYGSAAKRAKDCGVDVIELHAGHGYLPMQFLSVAFNRRTDEYGGDFDNRMRFTLEVIKAIRENVGPDYPLMMRISSCDSVDTEGGSTHEEMITYCKRCIEVGIDCIDVSRGNPFNASLKYEVPPIDVPVAYNVDVVAKYKEALDVPVVAVGRINDPEIAEDILKEGKADFVVVGRGQLADSEFCNKAMRDEAHTIKKCVGCLQGCYDAIVDHNMDTITCLFNPNLCHEEDHTIIPAKEPKKVLVIGGGPAGLETATVLKKRGHRVVLYEKDSTLGGQFYIAGAIPKKKEMGESALRMGELAREAGVEIHLNTEVTPKLIAEINPNEVVIAVGSAPIMPPIKGIDNKNVHVSHDILTGKVKVDGHIAVIGGGLVGVEIAELLSDEGKKVTIIEMQEEVAKDLGDLRKICAKELIYMNNIDSLVNSKCLALEEDGVLYELEGEEKKLEADDIVVAIGSRSLDFTNLKEHLEASNIPFHVVGDAIRARRAIDAIREGNEVARNI